MILLLHQLPTIHFGWTITAGNLIGGILAIVGAVASMIRFYTKLDACIHVQAEENRKLTEKLHVDNQRRIDVIETQVKDMHNWWVRYLERRR